MTEPPSSFMTSGAIHQSHSHNFELVASAMLGQHPWPHEFPEEDYEELLRNWTNECFTIALALDLFCPKGTFDKKRFLYDCGAISSLDGSA